MEQSPEDKEAARLPPMRYFIADLHLDGKDTPRALEFRAFLRQLSAQAAHHPVHLYILGDLFEFWYEYRNALFELYRTDLDALQAAWNKGVQVFLINGNRDFAYGNFAHHKFGATLLGDGERITLSDSRPAWLEHGDLLCTSDWRYRIFRRLVRSLPVRLLFWVLPFAFARAFIAFLQRRSAADRARKSTRTISINTTGANQRLRETGCRVLICGHAHQRAAADLSFGGRLLIVPAWCDTSGGYLDDGRSLRDFDAADFSNS